MTGYEEILTDPSYAGQIITFTFPHIGVVGATRKTSRPSISPLRPARVGAIFHAEIGEASNYRATRRLDDWLRARGIIGLTGVDTRALTAMIRETGMPNAVIAHTPDGEFDRAALTAQAKAWPGMNGLDLVPEVTTAQRLRLGRDQLDDGARLRPARRRRRLPGGRRRLRHQAQHPAPAQRLRLRGDRGPGDRDRRRDPGVEAGRRLPVERARRSGRDRQIRRADDQGAARRRACRCSASASATRCSAWRSARRR